jgi:hypothetical protein
MAISYFLVNLIFDSKVFIMFKGKGLLNNISTRTRRGTSRVSTNLEEAHQWEDDALYAAEPIVFIARGGQTPKSFKLGGCMKISKPLLPLQGS